MLRSQEGGRRELTAMALGGKRHHRKERHCGYKGKGLRVLLYVSIYSLHQRISNLHLLKLVTGVEISTRAIIKSGRPGKPVKRSSRTAAAVPNRAAFLLSIFMVGSVF